MERSYSLILLLFFAHFSLAQAGDIYNIARAGTVSDAAALLSNDPELLNSVNTSGFSPLILACYRGNTAVAKLLIDRKADLNYVSEMGTALMAAVVKGDAELVQYLLEHKADPNIPGPDGTTALIYAVQFENPKLVQLLLEYNANKSRTDKAGKTAFEHAVFSGNDAIINLLK